MDCEGIKKIIPAYIKHTAPKEEQAAVEEHLCVCNDCRKFLGQLMDEFADAQSSPAVESGAVNDGFVPAAVSAPAKDKEIARADILPQGSAVSGPENSALKGAAADRVVSGSKKKINLGDAVIIGVGIVALLFFLSFLMR